MQQTFEYYVVDPGTWSDIKKLDNVKSSVISRDLDSDTLGSATIDITDSIEECYIRIYLVTIQNGVKERHPLGTFLVQTPSLNFNGTSMSISMDAYTPLLELKEGLPPIGYSLLKGQNIMDIVYTKTRELVRAPVVKTKSDKKLEDDSFTADTDETWISFLSDLMEKAEYSFALDAIGRVLFSPKQDTASLQPVWTYDDNNSSILYPEISMNRDIYGIPNAVEVIYSSSTGTYYSKVVNDDENSPISTVNRGREIPHRVVNPQFPGEATEAQIKAYAKKLLSELSIMEYTISYTHGYCPVRIGDCVRLNYERSGITDIKAKVISQTIKCEPGCPVTEKAIFTAKLWG